MSLLRQKAQLLVDSIRNFIAVQSFAWGTRDKDPNAEAAYEIQVIDGLQRFRSYPEGKNQLKAIPLPHLNVWVLPSDEWAELPKTVATDLRLKVNQAPDAVLGERRIKVFQYYASVEDNVCPFQSFGTFKGNSRVAVACYGEVWTDADMNILRMSERLELSKKLKAYGGWDEWDVIMTYGWLKRENDLPRLVPLTIYTEGRNKKIYWCRGHFTDYRVFTAESRLITN